MNGLCKTPYLMTNILGLHMHPYSRLLKAKPLKVLRSKVWWMWFEVRKPSGGEIIATSANYIRPQNSVGGHVICVHWEHVIDIWEIRVQINTECSSQEITVITNTKAEWLHIYIISQRWVKNANLWKQLQDIHAHSSKFNFSVQLANVFPILQS